MATSTSCRSPERERLDELIGIDRRFEKVAKEAEGVFGHGLAVDKSEPLWQDPTAHVDVFRNRQIWEKTEFLVDRGDPDRAGVLRGQSSVLFAFDDNRPDVRRNQAAKNVLERRFSGAIFAHQSDDFSSRYRETCILQDPRAGVVLTDSVESDHWLFVALHGSQPRTLVDLAGIGPTRFETPKLGGRMTPYPTYIWRTKAEMRNSEMRSIIVCHRSSRGVAGAAILGASSISLRVRRRSAD